MDRKAVGALRSLVNLESMAIQIYRAQYWRLRQPPVLTEWLTHATENERKHLRELSAAVKDNGQALPLLRFGYAIFGWCMGFAPTLLGKVLTFRVDIWVEEKAVRDYTKYLKTYDFDERSRAILEQNRADEEEHVKTWQKSIDLVRGAA